MSVDRGPWILTFTGGVYHAQDPRPSDIYLDDIAHALSNLCRFSGHCRRFYCPTPDQRVLTSDLRWVPAGDLVVGDKLVGFDEHAIEPGSAGAARRRFRPATVTHAQPVRRKVIRLELSDGSFLRASEEHPWLTATKTSNNQSWQTAREIKSAVDQGRVRYLNRFMSLWSTEGSRDAGWLAGIYDGEGHASFRRAGVQSGMAQLPGAVLDHAIELHQTFGYHFRIGNVGSGGVKSLQLRGGWRELARLLGSLRPVRLLENFQRAFESGEFVKQMTGSARERLQVVAAHEEGEQWVSGLETSTHTYLCEGFGAHNSVAEHSVYVSLLVPPEHALQALLHDAPEAYLVDIPKPWKDLLPSYKELEDKAWRAISTNYRVPFDLYATVKAADIGMLHMEREQLLPARGPDWNIPGDPQAAAERIGHIECLAPRDARRMFLDRFNALNGARLARQRDAFDTLPDDYEVN